MSNRSPSGHLRAGIFEGNRGSVQGSVHELKTAVSLTNRIAYVGRNSRPYLAAIALASSDAFRVGLPVSSMVTSAIIESKMPPGELMMI